MDKTLTQVLLIEDNPDDVQILREALEQDPLAFFEVTTVNRLKLGVGLLQEQLFAVILLDLGLPDSQGLETFIKLHKAAPAIPVVILSGSMDEELALQAIQFGAQDYLVKRQEAWETTARAIRYAVERQRSQISVLESENRFRAVFEHSPVAYQALDVNGNYIDFNTQLCELLGYKPHELMRESFAQLWSPETRATFPRKFARCKRDGQMEADLQLLKKDGTILEVLLLGRVQYDTDGQALRIHCILHDITARKIAEQAMHESQERFATVFRSSPIGIAISRLADGMLVDVNEAFLKIFEYTRREIIGRTTLELNFLHDSDDRAKMIARLRKHGQVTDLELKGNTKTGEVRNILVSAELIELDGKHHVLNMVSDITLRKRVEQALHDNEKRFNSLLENGLDNISLLSADGVLLWESPATIRTLDYTPNEFVGRNIFELLHPDERERILTQFADLVQQPGVRWRDTFRLRHSDGSWRWVEAAVTNLINEPSVQAIVVNYHDSSEQKHLEHALQKSEKLFPQIFQFSPIPLAIEDAATGMIITVNESYLHLTGYAAEAVVGNTMAELNIYVDKKQPTPISPILYRPGDVQGVAFKLRTKSGELRDVLDWNDLILYDHEKVKLRAIVDITEHKRAEEALHRGEAVLEQAGQVAQLGAWEIEISNSDDLNANPLIWSDQTYRIFGYEPGEVKSSNELFFECVHPDDRQRIMNTIGQAIAEKQPYEIEHRIIRPDGTERIVFEYAQITFDPQGRPLRMIGAVQDLTERRQVEATLLGEQRKAQKYLDIVGVMLLALDQSGRVTMVNQKACEILGYPADEIIGRDWLNTFLPPGIRDELQDVFQRFIAGSEEAYAYYENPILTKNGEERLIAWRNIMIRDNHGVIVSTLSSGEDITERKQAENALQHSEQRFRTLIDQLPAVVYIDDSSTKPGRTQFLSPYIETMLGYTPEEWIEGGEELWKDRIHPDDREQVLAGYELSIQSGQPLKLEYRMCARDERVMWVVDQATTVHDSLGKPQAVHGVMYDITERKQAEMEVSHQVSELEALYENGLAISRMLEPKQIADRIVQVLDQKLNWHHAAVRVYHPESSHLELLALSQPGLNALQIEAQIERVNQFNINPEHGLSGWVIRHGTVVRSGNLKENPNYVETYPGINSGLYVPIRSGEEVIGSIAVESEQADAFTDRDERLLSTLANQAAISFVNARLYLRLQYELSERRRSEDKIRKLNAELEQRVRERTFEIETTHQRLELATASSGIGVWELTAGRDSFYWDERMYGIYGMAVEQFNPTFASWLELIHPEDRRAEAENRARAMMQAGPYESEYRIIRADGLIRHINSHAVVVVDEHRNFKNMIGVNMDITPIKQAEETLRMANTELQRALNMKDEFLANMSHELRTPLNVILGLSESLDEQIAGPLNEKQQKYIHTISESGYHLLSLINDILDLAKIEAGQIKLDIHKIDIHAVCQASLRMIKELAQKKNQMVEFDIDDNADLIWADERRLKQMLVNLLSNAVKFTGPGGRIGLELRVDESNNQVAITVWDSGIGIASKDMKRLFQPFVQLDAGLARQSEGTGLGLALVAQMARLHGGSITATSQPGAGSRFTIVLPWEPILATDTTERMKVTGKFRAVKSDHDNSRRTILLVEDTEEVIIMLRDYLESATYKVVTATNGLDAIMQAKRIQPDLILMDIQMPGIDGVEATKKLRNEPEFQNTPIIALTALAMPNDRARCLAAGMNEYVSKPVKLKALLKIIEGFLANK